MNGTNQEKFSSFLDNYPFLKPFWDQDEDICHEERLRTTPLISGQRIVANVALSIWSGGRDDSSSTIEFADLAKLSEEYRSPLVSWLNDPFLR